MLLERILGMIDIQKIIEYKKNNKRTEIGADLFLLYVTLNEIYVTGLEIVQELEKLVQRRDRPPVTGDSSKLFTDLSAKIIKQKNNLLRFLASFNRLDAELQLIDRDSYNAIRGFVYPKMGLLDHLLHVLNRDGKTEFSLFFLSEKQINEVLTNEYDDPLGISTGFRGPLKRWDFERWNRARISDIDQISVSQLDVINEYLELRKPRKQLEFIKSDLDRIYDGLIKHFTVEELLIKVGDRQVQLNIDLPHWQMGNRY
jgi:hypothetical protein